MPDVAGMPTVLEVFQKIKLTAPSPVTQDLSEAFGGILAPVIAEFQSPPSPIGNGGGTGRTFVPASDTRWYDGSGAPEQIVDDVVPSLPFTVVAGRYSSFSLSSGAYGSPVLRQPQEPGAGWNILTIPSGGWYAGYTGYTGIYSRFPRGLQNIGLTATFGYAAQVPYDVWEAIRCEAAYRLLVEGYVGLTGVGEEVHIGDYSINTSVGAINFKLTSPLTTFHDKYLECVARYRVSPQRAWSRYAVRHQMS